MCKKGVGIECGKMLRQGRNNVKKIMMMQKSILDFYSLIYSYPILVLPFINNISIKKQQLVELSLFTQ